MLKAFLATTVIVASASVLPAIAMTPAPLSSSASGVTLVAEGCGAGWVRGPNGHCHRAGAMVGGPVVVAPVIGLPVVVAPVARRCVWRAGVRVC